MDLTDEWTLRNLKIAGVGFFLFVSFMPVFLHTYGTQIPLAERMKFREPYEVANSDLGQYLFGVSIRPDIERAVSPITEWRWVSRRRVYGWLNTPLEFTHEAKVILRGRSKFCSAEECLGYRKTKSGDMEYAQGGIYNQPLCYLPKYGDSYEVVKYLVSPRTRETYDLTIVRDAEHLNSCVYTERSERS